MQAEPEGVMIRFETIPTTPFLTIPIISESTISEGHRCQSTLEVTGTLIDMSLSMPMPEV